MSFNQNALVWVLIFLVLASGGFNRVFYKILITPLTNTTNRLSYAFFLSTCNSIFYVIFYGTLTLIRCKFGLVERNMMSYPWKCSSSARKRDLFVTGLPPITIFMLMGALDGLGGVIGLLAAPYISGVMISMMLQSIIFFSMLASMVLLKSRYSLWQVLSIFTVLCGAMLALIPEIVAPKVNGPVANMSRMKYIGYHLLMACSTFPHSISFTLREAIFIAYPGFDAYLVNLHASLWQAMFSPIFITLTVCLNILLEQTQGQTFTEFLFNGIQCILLQKTTINDDKIQCEALRGPLFISLPFTFPYVCYILCNLCLNVSLVNLVKYASSLQCFMTLKAILPVAILLFFFKWPLLFPQTPSPYVFGGLVVALTGLIAFRKVTIMRENLRKEHGDKATHCFSLLPLILPTSKR